MLPEGFGASLAMARDFCKIYPNREPFSRREVIIAANTLKKIIQSPKSDLDIEFTDFHKGGYYEPIGARAAVFYSFRSTGLCQTIVKVPSGRSLFGKRKFEYISHLFQYDGESAIGPGQTDWEQIILALSLSHMNALASKG